MTVRPRFRRTLEQLLESIRLNAQVKVINNQLEQKPYYSIIRKNLMHRTWC